MIRRASATIAAAICAALMLAAPAHAIGPHEALPDPAKEARARELFKQLRCLVCQNQSIDDSDADLARDLRIIVRERIQAGDSNEEVIEFLRTRYGDFVLLKPPVKGSTIALWVAPFAILLIGGGLIIIAVRRRRAPERAQAALSDEDRARVDAMLSGGDKTDDRR